ncbi:tyrosine-type recombinase/integrase [Parapusillimonas granuli]|uniref:Integrase arm-type DNA-binding domain-containing protein n=1 Tax=Parapusillimonas granuli TaxID=380911 RepID=A0A853G8B1_9BURK|nr:integrase arm-type DNA-binding domain-containing protein [Parapusillimonas granuli]MBB5217338.1 integrase [Parapusillimonas granuli]MEB2401913.1 integrase arm-type DNA-binding domain-containing protein [Alcaligenaceae bacterium]NYT50871.1 integrase arm-type DNA-binding domain-containing protein [Parapusillimonas granuli]
MATSLLTVRKIETATPQPKPYSLKDGGSLYLYVTPAGGKLWRYRYRIGSVSQVFSIGKYPEVSLQAARLERDKARELVKQGIHPLINKKALLSQQIQRNGHTFEAVAHDWMKSNKSWSDTYAKQVKSYLERDIFPVIGKLPITAVGVLNIRPLILDISERGVSAAMAVRQWISQIFSYGAQQGLCEHDPAAMLKRLVKRPPIRHNPPLPWQEIAPFMRKLDDWDGFFTTKTALKLVALTFVRTVEIRRATWDQFSLEDATWSIPAENMKMRRPHLVPLSRQTLALLKELHAVTGHGKYLIPNSRRPNQPIGVTTLNHAIESLGYRGRFSTHGFRSTATTLLSLLSYPDNRVDLQLAHTKKDPSRAPYEHTKYVSSRRILMQDWADILDALTQGATLQQITEEFGPMSERRSAFLKVVEREY